MNAVQLFIPRAQIYALRDTIPFHLQLRGSVESLRLFLGMPATEQQHINTCPGSPGPPSATAPDSLRALAQKSQSRDSNANYSPIVRVYLRRQISVEVKGFRAYQDVVIGEGKVKQVEYPPQWSPAGAPSKNTHVDEGKEDYSLEWEGQVRCNDNIDVPSFVSGGLFVRVSVSFLFFYTPLRIFITNGLSRRRLVWYVGLHRRTSSSK